ncbi:PspC domain-containing protein [Nocardioides sp.]|uniref:PspC domain-containing protein n=1 Tax=Nocardioides sp. TaxID=35761 RepID=UPI003562CE4A
MTQIPPSPPTGNPADPNPSGDQGPRATGEEIRDLGRLRRTIGPDRKIAGVAGGLARHLDIDPLIVRVALVVLVFFGGAGLIIYAACWLLVPEDGAPRAPFGFDDRNRSIALIIVGVIAVLALLGDTIGQVGFPWPLAILGLIVLIVVSFFDKDRPRPTAPPVPHAPPGYQPWTSATPPAPMAPPGAPDYSAGYASAGYPAGYPTYVPPQPPHKRGPKLFWFTAALSALAVGVLGIIDQAGAGVADSAYPALVLAICGVMLLVGAFYGRAGGIILLGLLAAIATAVSTSSDRLDSRDVWIPTSAVEVQSTYKLGVGELVLDLTEVRDLENLDGRTITVDLNVGSVEVLVPEGLDVNAHAQVGLGDVWLLGQHQDGIGIDASAGSGSGVSAPDLELDIQLGLGEVRVVTEAATTQGATR